MSLSLVALSQACLSPKTPLIALSCPPAVPHSAPPPPAPKPAEPAITDGPRVATLPPQPERPKHVLTEMRSPLVRKPFTLVVNNRVVAVVPADADSVVENAAWAKLDPSRIETMELVTTPRAQACNAAIVGTLVLVTIR